MENLKEKYYELIVSKTYLDCFSSEFKNKDTDDKLVNMSLYIKEGGDLHYAINTYKSVKSQYTLTSLIPTLLYYIDYLRTRKPMTVLNVLLRKYLSEHQLIEILSAELKERLYFEFEDYKSLKEIYKIRIGGYKIEDYIDKENKTKKENLISILKGDLSIDLDYEDLQEKLVD